MFEEFINIVAQKLENPLPGHESHRKMMNSEKLRFKTLPDETTRSSAVLIVFYPDIEHIMLPLILRPKYDGTHGGQMALPGGKKEHTDENLTRTALREAQEEIGIKAIDVKILGKLTEVFIPVSNFIVQPIVGFLDYKPTFYPDAKEVDEIVELGINDFFAQQNKSSRLMKIGGNEIDVPGFEIKNQWIWGATALIMNEFIEAIS